MHSMDEIINLIKDFDAFILPAADRRSPITSERLLYDDYLILFIFGMVKRVTAEVRENRKVIRWPKAALPIASKR